MTAFSNNWNAAYEAIPADSADRSEGALRIRDEKTDTQERIDVDHYMALAGVQADHGEHRQITFHEPIATPANVANKGFLYLKDVAGKAELHFEDEDGNELQLTSAGALDGAIPSGSKMLFYQDAAPTGFTIDATVNDKLVFVTKGSVAGGLAGGIAHATGTWTQPNHSHTYNTVIAHVHTVKGIAGGSGAGAIDANQSWSQDSNISGVVNSTGAASGTTAGGATANTWRPAAYNCIIATKD